MTIRNIAIPRKLALAFAVLIATFSIVSLVVFANVRTLHQVAATRDEAKLASDHADDMLGCKRIDHSERCSGGAAALHL